MKKLADMLAGGDVTPRLDALLDSRMLIQANSGGGKSYATRKLLEITHGLVQQIVIDPEGEFASLREKFDYVYAAAKDGDALAHPKTAKLLAERLLETGVSAIIDIYELKAHERHAFVRIFLDTMVNAPKSLWHPVLVVLDEAHVFAPEQEKSEAHGAVADMATRGRKRGFCLVAATQRISKLSKDVAAELNNKLIGRAALDVDVKRAAGELGISTKEAWDVLPKLEPGVFFAFGPALPLIPTQVRIAAVESRHPKRGDRHSAAPPKPTAAILKVLPKLADLPKESEQEAKTMADLKRDLADTRRKLTEAEKSAAGHKAINAAWPPAKAQLQAEYARGFTVGDARGRTAVYETMKGVLKATEKNLVKSLTLHIDSEVKNWAEGLRNVCGAEATAKSVIVSKAEIRSYGLDDKDPRVQHAMARAKLQAMDSDPPRRREGGARLSAPQQRILDAIAWLKDKGIYPPPKNTLAAVAGCSPTSGTYANNLSKLKVAGLIEYPTPGMVAFTDAGEQESAPPDNDGKAVHDKWLEILNGPQQKIVRALLDIGGDNQMSKEDLANVIQASPTSGTYANNLSSLKVLGAIHYPKPGRVALTNYVIPE